MRIPQKLPTDLQSFETIREDGYLYVDKTRFIHRMTEEGRFYFLSRPRRFGKSLTVSTLRCLFQGKKELFDGLWITNQNWEWKEYPVITIDFNEISHDTPENLKQSLDENLEYTAQLYGIKLNSLLLKGKFRELVLALFEKSKMPAVILIDEYDKPIIDHLGKGEKALNIAKENRDILKSFLGILKGVDVAPHTRFVFITGVSKFSRVSVFSELNNLIDLTMNERYADMFGYTQQELETYFKDHLKQFSETIGVSEKKLVEKLKLKYDGYRFSEREVRVYNPFSVLRALSNEKFKNYWFESGTPTFLINLLKEKQYDLSKIEGLQVSEQIFSTYDLENLRPEALLFQTGYVTISSVKGRLYMLNYPNQEVKTAFLEHLLFSFSQESRGEENSKFLLLSDYLETEDFELFFETVNSIFASIPYTLETQRNEAYFHTLFYLMVCASGMDVHTEVLTSRGRIDLIAEFSDKIIVTEFKCNQSAETALKQIREKGYAEKFRQSGKKIILLGINFSSENRNVAEWMVWS